MRRALKWTAIAFAGLTSLVVVGYLGLWLAAREAIGGAAEGERLERMQRSPQFRDGKFRNALPRIDGPPLDMLTSWFFAHSPHAVPSEPLPIERRTGRDYDTPPPSGLRVTWFGHSTALIEIDGRRLLVDPVWGERASPFSFLGPERWYAAPLPLAELPEIDAVIVSHDHYDHLDHLAVSALAARETRWFAPLGIGADLAAWGVPEDRIVELDWWESSEVGGLTVVATPARHFSGRWVDDAAETLWSGWAVVGPRHRVFCSGDTAMHEQFAEIGKRHGPFDLTLIEVGAYDALWADVHLGPEQAVEAHRLVGGRVLLPVHWGLFDLALHGWTEPIERVLRAARGSGVRVAVPRPGELLEPAHASDPVAWWPSIPWREATEAPVVSSGLAGR